MKKNAYTLVSGILLMTGSILAQGPAVTSWLQNTTITGTYYNAGNSTPIGNGILVNCQKVEYSADWVYVTTEGVPSYTTGPFQDGNPSQASAQGAIYKIPLVPTENTGIKTPTGMGTAGVFINGTSLFDYQDGVQWDPSTNALCGGPGNSPCPGGMGAVMDWTRDAIPAEMDGFDCSKGHPAMGTYHHHQNPSAFDLDLNVLSTVCNLYDADGLYAISATEHAPLIGFAYDGFPIYGAYGYQNADGTGGIVRMKSGFELGITTVRTNYPDGTDVDDGPVVDGTYFAGYFKEDYQWVEHPGQEDYLDIHNGRFCVTPEYPDGIYCYFATVDADWNSAFPYAVGPTYYGNVVASNVNNVGETTTVYEETSFLTEMYFDKMNVKIFPNPATDLIAIQIVDLVQDNLAIELIDVAGKTVQKTQINKGGTIAHFNVETIYAGVYFIKISNDSFSSLKKVIIE
ncbi:MAG: YHYH protein [Flavobacteriales bacterium]|nr:YHYH protein [Flavobacteriales bacterium]